MMTFDSGTGRFYSPSEQRVLARASAEGGAEIERLKRCYDPRPKPTILEVMDDPRYFGAWFQGANWDGWRAFLAAAFGLDMTPKQYATFRRHTGRDVSPTAAAREVYTVVGRRGGKSRVCALIAVYLAIWRDYSAYLSPGEIATIPVIAARRDETRTVMGYIKAYLAIPALSGRVIHNLGESMTLDNRVRIEVHTANFKSTRGYTLVAAVLDEIAFWATAAESASPDAEVLAALRPATATIPNAMILGLSSPYARMGVLWDMYDRYFGKADKTILVWHADTASMNPTVDKEFIASEYVKDPDKAAAEYGANFRMDIERGMSPEAIKDAIIEGRTEIPPQGGITYRAFVDPSGGINDSMTLAIAHETEVRAMELPENIRKIALAGMPKGVYVIPRGVLDFVQEWRPPFSPAQVVKECCDILKRYGCGIVVGDRYAGEWPRERFREHDVSYQVSEYSASELYANFNVRLNSRQVEILDVPRLKFQLTALDRRIGSGSEKWSHPPGGHDDVCNVAAGALLGAGPSLYRIDAADEEDDMDRTKPMQAQVEQRFPEYFQANTQDRCGACDYWLKRENDPENRGYCQVKGMLARAIELACDEYVVRPGATESEG